MIETALNGDSVNTSNASSAVQPSREIYDHFHLCAVNEDSDAGSSFKYATKTFKGTPNRRTREKRK